MSNKLWNWWHLIVRFFTRDPGLRDEPPTGLPCELCGYNTPDPMFYRGHFYDDDCHADAVKFWREEHAD